MHFTKVIIIVTPGTVSPLIGIGFQASAMFFSYQFCKRFFNQFKENKNDRLPLHFVAAAAAIASIPTSLIAVNTCLIAGSSRTCQNKNSDSEKRSLPNVQWFSRCGSVDR